MSARIRWALAAAVVGIVLCALFWLIRPPVGLAWVVLGALPAILGLVALALTGRIRDKERRGPLPTGRPVTAANVLGLISVVVGAPSFVLVLWVIVLVIVSLR